MSLAQNLDYTIDLQEPLKIVNTGADVAVTDQMATTFNVTVTDGGSEASLTGAVVVLYFLRSDGMMVRCAGTASENVASVTLPANCYSYGGIYVATMQITVGAVVRTVLRVVGIVEGVSDATIIDPTGSIPTVEQMEVLMAQMESQIATSQQTITDATEAIATIDGMTVSATTLATGADATATISEVAGAKHITFGLPRGPQGVPGAGNVSTVAGVQPDNAGNVPLTASDILAVPAAQLIDMIYPIGSIYMSVNVTSPATFLGGTWERVEDKFLLAAGSTYTAGTSGGAASVTLEQANLPAHQALIPGEPVTNSPEWAEPNQAVVYRYMAGTPTGSVPVSTGGSGMAIGIMPPYLAVYAWTRVA